MPRISRASWYALTLVALANAMSLLDRNILAILAPRIKADLHIGDAEMGLLYGTVFALFYALFSLPLGRLADGWIRTRLLGLAMGFWSIATGMAAFAHGFALLALSRLGVGIGEGAVYPAGYSLVFDHFPKARRGVAMAVIAAAIALGLGCSLMLGGVAADWWDHRYLNAGAPLGLHGWQFAFLVAALPGFVVAALLLANGRAPARPARWHRLSTRPAPVPRQFCGVGFGDSGIQLAGAGETPGQPARLVVECRGVGSADRLNGLADATHQRILTAAAAALRRVDRQPARSPVELWSASECSSFSISCRACATPTGPPSW